MLELQTLEIHPDKPGLFYYPTSEEVCVKKLIGICIKKETVTKFKLYDTNDPVIRKMLVDKDFVLVVREKP